VAVGVALLGAVALRVDWGEFAAVVAGASPAWLLLVLGAGVADRLWMAGKWHYLLRGLGVPARFFDAALAYFVGHLVGLATQWQLSGDVTRAVRVGRAFGRHGRVAASVVLEKLTGAAASALVAAGALALLTLRYGVLPRGAALGGAALLAAGSAAALVLALSRAGARVLRRVAHVHPALQALLARLGVTDAVGASDGQGRALGRVGWTFFALTLLEQAMPVLDMYLLKQSLGLSVDTARLLAAVPVVMFVSRLPISIDGIGVYEGLSVVLYGLLGLSASQSLALAVLARAVGLLGTAAGAAVCLALSPRVVTPTSSP